MPVYFSLHSWWIPSLQWVAYLRFLRCCCLKETAVFQFFLVPVCLQWAVTCPAEGLMGRLIHELASTQVEDVQTFRKKLEFLSSESEYRVFSNLKRQINIPKWHPCGKEWGTDYWFGKELLPKENVFTSESSQVLQSYI